MKNQEPVGNRFFTAVFLPLFRCLSAGGGAYAGPGAAFFWDEGDPQPALQDPYQLLCRGRLLRSSAHVVLLRPQAQGVKFISSRGRKASAFLHAKGFFMGNGINLWTLL